MRSCTICKYIKKNSSEGISYHTFPKDENILKLWISAMGKENFTPSKSSTVCSRHFTNDSFYYPPGGLKMRRQLKKNAVPTIFEDFDAQPFNNGNITVIDVNMDERVPLRFTAIEDINNAATIISRVMTHENADILNLTDGENISGTDDNVIDNNFCYMERGVEFIDTVLTLEENDNASDMETGSKRDSISNEHFLETPTKWKRRLNPRFFGDCDERDMCSPRRALRNWRIAVSTVTKQKRKIAKLQQDNIRLKRRIETMKSLIVGLKKKTHTTNFVLGRTPEKVFDSINDHNYIKKKKTILSNHG